MSEGTQGGFKIVLMSDYHIPNPEAWCSHEAFDKIQKMVKALHSERQKAEILKQALEGIAFLSQCNADKEYFWDGKRTVDLIETICTDTIIARDALKKLEQE